MVRLFRRGKTRGQTNGDALLGCERGDSNPHGFLHWIQSHAHALRRKITPPVNSIFNELFDKHGI